VLVVFGKDMGLSLESLTEKKDGDTLRECRSRSQVYWGVFFMQTKQSEILISGRGIMAWTRGEIEREILSLI
jgi:hypothetical protein